MGLWAEVCGWFGAMVVLAGYTCFSLGWITNGRLFQLSNLTGPAALIVNGCYHGAWPSVALNIAWGSIAAIALARLQGRVRTAGQTSADKAGPVVDSLIYPERRSG